MSHQLEAKLISGNRTQRGRRGSIPALEPHCYMMVVFYSRKSAISYQLSAISYQLSAISYQLSAISYQLSAISYQLSAISYQLSAISYQLSKT
ncbi:hypothetical protein AADY36_02230 [Pseudoalteromonas sp. D15MCD-2]|uniref:hypothetical protein n=1 Tax=Pseudoalteromonas sp. D15MCD-2 TaxID=3138933 RepID=UPI00315922D2